MADDTGHREDHGEERSAGDARTELLTPDGETYCPKFDTPTHHVWAGQIEQGVACLHCGCTMAHARRFTAGTMDGTLMFPGHADGEDLPTLASRGGRDVPHVDLFLSIARHFFDQIALITPPNTLDPRWPALVAQAYREGIAAAAAPHANGICFRMAPDGMLETYGLD